jgi:hypothetical protein
LAEQQAFIDVADGIVQLNQRIHDFDQQLHSLHSFFSWSDIYKKPKVPIFTFEEDEDDDDDDDDEEERPTKRARLSTSRDFLWSDVYKGPLVPIFSFEQPQEEESL